MVNDQPCEFDAPYRRQWCVSVSHDDLRVQNVSVVTHILPEVFAISTVHNVCGNYS